MGRHSAVIAVVAAAACFATLAVLTRLAYAAGGSALPLLSWRFAIAAGVLALYLAATSPRALADGLADVPRFAALSLTGYGAASVCFFFALRFASASVVTVLLYAYPAIVAFADALLRRERIGARRTLAIALTFVGCALAAGLAGAAVDVSAAGVALGLGAAAGYALFTLLSARLVSRSRLVLMTYTFGLSAVGIGAVALIAGDSLLPTGWSATLWLLLGGMVLLPTVAAVLLFLHGVRTLGASRTALISTLEPVFTIAMAAAFLGERLSLAQAAGAVLVLAGIVVAEWPQRVPPQPV